MRACRDVMRKTKVHLELNVVREVKDNKKGFLKYVSSKTKTRENVGPLLNEVGALVMEDTEKVKLLNTFFVLVFISNTALSESQTLKVKERIWRKVDFPTVEENLVRDHRGKLSAHKSMGPNGIHTMHADRAGRSDCRATL